MMIYRFGLKAVVIPVTVVQTPGCNVPSVPVNVNARCVAAFPYDVYDSIKPE